MLLHLLRLVADVGLHRTVRHIAESVRTGLLIRERGAHPRLHVAHLEPERRRVDVVDLAHLLERAADLVDSVVEVLEAVVERGGGSAVGAVVAGVGEVGDVAGHSAGVGEADGNGDASEGGRILLNGVGVAGEGGVADVRIESDEAATADELGTIGGGVGGGGGIGIGGGGNQAEVEESGCE